MKTLKTVVIVLALLLFVVAAAEAIDLYTAPLYAGNLDKFYCVIYNVSTAEKTVRIRIIDGDGIIISEWDDLVLEAGHDVNRHLDDADGVYYCQFTFTGAKTQVRACAQIRPGHNVTVKATLAAE